MADLAAAGRAGAARFTDRERREVVVQDEALAGRAAGVGVEVLRLLAGGEGGDAERLGFTALEQAGAVRAGQEADFRREGANLHVTATVHALLLVQDGDAERLLLDVLEGGADLEGGGVPGIFARIAALTSDFSAPTALPRAALVGL